MPQPRSEKPSESKKTAQQLTLPTKDERDEDESDNESHGSIDEEEEALVRMVLGDEPGFLAELSQGAVLGDRKDFEAESEAGMELDRDEEDLGGIDDADVSLALEVY
jgi:hypothetical protein